MEKFLLTRSKDLQLCWLLWDIVILRCKALHNNTQLLNDA